MQSEVTPVARSILNAAGTRATGFVAAWLVLMTGGHSPGAIADAPPAAVAAFRVERDVAVPMRDDAVLRADVYRPQRDGRFPVLVYRTPYGKHHAAESYQTHLKAVARGYVVVLQDVRGRYASGGRFDPYRQEGPDGYDTIEWAASQPWSNGSGRHVSACRIRGPCNGSPRWRRRRTSRRWRPR